MANRYWNPSWNANWWDANVWATTDWWDPTWVATPTSSDDVFFTSTNSYKCTVDWTANCLNLDFTWYTWIFYGRTPQILNIYWSLTFSSWMTTDFYCDINLLATSSGKTINSNGKIPNSNIIINWVWWEYTLQNNFTTNKDFTLTKWTFITGNYNFKSSNFIISWTDTRALTLWNNQIECTTFTATTTTNLTFTKWTSTIKVTWINFLWWWLTYYNLNHSPSWETWQIVWANTFNNLEIYPRINKLSSYSLVNDQIISWTLTISWNSNINRAFIKSDTKWTQRTITCNWTVTVTNADFQDITWAWSASWDLSAITGLSWDCGGNSWMTLTTWTTTNWESWATWSTATWSVRVPLPQDTATFTTAWTQTITQDMPRIWSVDFTWSANKTWTTSTNCSVFGSINLTDLATLTNSNNTYTLEGRNYNNMPIWWWVLNSGWKTWGKLFTIDCVDWTYWLWSNFETNGSAWDFTVTSWTFNTNNFNMTLWTNQWFNSTGSKTRAINLWTSLIQIQRDWTQVDFTTVTNLSFNAWQSTIKLIWTITSNRIFTWWWLTFYNVWNATSWAYAITVTWSNTFNDFKIDAWRQVKFTKSTNNTVTTFTTPNTWDKVVLRSSTTTNATLTKAWWWVISCDYIDIDYITGSPDDTWYMWTHSTDWWHNSQIYFTEPPATTNTTNFFMFF
jgi:hypothetical protein